MDEANMYGRGYQNNIQRSMTCENSHAVAYAKTHIRGNYLGSVYHFNNQFHQIMQQRHINGKNKKKVIKKEKKNITLSWFQVNIRIFLISITYEKKM